MPEFERCARCGEMLTENYGACRDSNCVRCAKAEARVAERRGCPRIGTTAPAVLSTLEDAQPVEIIDVSLGGARVSAAHEPPIDATLTLTVAGTARLEARRVWRDGAMTGIMFLNSPHVVKATMDEIFLEARRSDGA